MCFYRRKLKNLRANTILIGHPNPRRHSGTALAGLLFLNKFLLHPVEIADYRLKNRGNKKGILHLPLTDNPHAITKTFKTRERKTFTFSSSDFCTTLPTPFACSTTFWLATDIPLAKFEITPGTKKCTHVTDKAPQTPQHCLRWNDWLICQTSKPKQSINQGLLITVQGSPKSKLTFFLNKIDAHRFLLSLCLNIDKVWEVSLPKKPVVRWTLAAGVSEKKQKCSYNGHKQEKAHNCIRTFPSHDRRFRRGIGGSQVFQGCFGTLFRGFEIDFCCVRWWDVHNPRGGNICRTRKENDTDQRCTCNESIFSTNLPKKVRVEMI